MRDGREACVASDRASQEEGDARHYFVMMTVWATLPAWASPRRFTFPYRPRLPQNLFATAQEDQVALHLSNQERHKRYAKQPVIRGTPTTIPPM